MSDVKKPIFALDEDGVVFKEFFDSKEGFFKVELPDGRIVSPRSVDDNSVIKADGSPVTEEDFVRAKNSFLASENKKDLISR